MARPVSNSTTPSQENSSCVAFGYAGQVRLRLWYKLRRGLGIFFHQGAGQCNRPAGQDDNEQGQNEVSGFYFGEKARDKAKVHAENRYDKRQNSNKDHQRAQQGARRLDIKGLKDFALGEGFRCGGHSAGWARQAGILLEAATAEPEAHIGLVMAGNAKNDEKADN